MGIMGECESMIEIVIRYRSCLFSFLFAKWESVEQGLVVNIKCAWPKQVYRLHDNFCLAPEKEQVCMRH